MRRATVWTTQHCKAITKNIHNLIHFRANIQIYTTSIRMMRILYASGFGLLIMLDDFRVIQLKMKFTGVHSKKTKNKNKNKNIRTRNEKQETKFN